MEETDNTEGQNKIIDDRDDYLEDIKEETDDIDYEDVTDEEEGD